MPRRPKDTRIVTPVVVDFDLRSQEDDGYEFDDMSRRTSSKERDISSRELQDEDIAPNYEIKQVPIDEVEDSQDSQRPTRRRQPARLGYRSRPDPIVVDMKSPEDNGFEFRDISYTNPKGKPILKTISATVAKGEMLAVMVRPVPQFEGVLSYAPRTQGPPGSNSCALLSSLSSAGGQGVTGQITFEGLTKFDLRSMSYVPKVSNKPVY